jgi:hypothetical protein
MSEPAKKQKIVSLRTFADDVKLARDASIEQKTPTSPAPTVPPPPPPNTTKPIIENLVAEEDSMSESDPVFDEPDISQEELKSLETPNSAPEAKDSVVKGLMNELVEPLPSSEPVFEEPDVDQDEPESRKSPIEIPPFHSIRASSPDDTAYTERPSYAHKKTRAHSLVDIPPPPSKDAPTHTIEVDTTALAEYQESVLSSHGNVFDAEEADAGTGEGSIVTDRKRERFRLFPAIFAALSSWFSTKKDEIEEAHTVQRPIVKSERRKEVIQAAAEQAKQAPADDHEQIAEKLKNVERITSKEEFKIKDASEVPEVSWQHTREDNETEPDQTDESLDDALNSSDTPSKPLLIEDAHTTQASPLLLDESDENEEQESVSVSPPEVPEPEKHEGTEHEVLAETEAKAQDDVKTPVESASEKSENSSQETLSEDRPAEEEILESKSAPKDTLDKETTLDTEVPAEPVEEEKPSGYAAHYEKLVQHKLNPTEETVLESVQSIPDVTEKETPQPKFNQTDVPGAQLGKIGQPKQQSQKGFKFPVLIVVIIVAILLGVGVSAWYFTRDTQDENIIVPIIVSELITTNSTLEIPFTEDRDAFIRSIQAAIASQETGAVEIKPITDDGQTMDSTTLLNTLMPNIPGNFERAVTQVSLGGFNGAEAIIVMKFTSFDTVFGSLLDMEDTLYADLAPLYGEAASTRSIDSRVNNKGIRVLTGEDEEDKIVYGFIDKNTLLVTTSREVYSSVSSLVK